MKVGEWKNVIVKYSEKYLLWLPIDAPIMEGILMKIGTTSGRALFDIGDQND